MKIDKLIKHQLIYFIKKFRISQEMKELFDSKAGYVLVTEELKKQWEILDKLNVKLITWVNKGCAGEIISSPGEGELINRFNMFNKQFSFYN